MSKWSHSNLLAIKLHLIIIDSLSASDKSYSDCINVIYNKYARLGIISRLAFQFIVPKKLHQTLTSIKPDIIYLRYPLYRPFISKVFSEIQIPIVMEINGNPLDELQAGRKNNILSEKIRVNLCRRASGFVGVTEESIRYALQCRMNHNFPHIVISSSVDCNKIQFLNYYPITTSIILLILAAELFGWN